MRPIFFNGDFNDTESAKGFLELFSNYKVVSKVLLDSSLKDNREVTSFTKRVVLKFLENRLPEWSIVYRDRKLLIEGKCFSEDIRKSVDTILSISNINYFNNIKIVRDREFEVVETLRHVIPKRDSREDIDSDRAEEIISSLREVTDIKEPVRAIRDLPKPTLTPSPSQPPKITIKKIEDKRDSIELIRDTNKTIDNIVMEKREYFKYDNNRQMNIERVDSEESDIMKLPCVQFIDDDKPLNIKNNHVIDEGVVYIPPSSVDEVEPKDIPWAKLHDLDEEIDGILISDPIN